MLDLQSQISDQALRDYDLLRDDSGLLDLPHVALMTLSGDDRKGWLQGQATSDLRKLEGGASNVFCLTTITGHLLSVCEAWAVSDRLLITLPERTMANVLKRVEQMVIGLDRKAGCPSHDGWAVGSRELECGEHFNITDGRLRDEAGSNCSHLGQPMHRLQDLQSATDNGFDERKCLLGIRFSCRILEQPFENYTRIKDDDHGRSADRALRTSSLVKVGRPLRATRN